MLLSGNCAIQHGTRLYFANTAKLGYGCTTVVGPENMSLAYKSTKGRGKTPWRRSPPPRQLCSGSLVATRTSLGAGVLAGRGQMGSRGPAVPRGPPQQTLRSQPSSAGSAPRVLPTAGNGLEPAGCLCPDLTTEITSISFPPVKAFTLQTRCKDTA